MSGRTGFYDVGREPAPRRRAVFTHGPRRRIFDAMAGPGQQRAEHPVTPDGRYFVVRGRLWRCSDPSLSAAERQAHVDALMAARRAVRAALAGRGDLPAARAEVDAAKRALGERGPAWWSDGAPDHNRRLARNSPYAAWFAALDQPATPSRTNPGLRDKG